AGPRQNELMATRLRRTRRFAPNAVDDCIRCGIGEQCDISLGVLLLRTRWPRHRARAWAPGLAEPALAGLTRSCCPLPGLSLLRTASANDLPCLLRCRPRPASTVAAVAVLRSPSGSKIRAPKSADCDALKAYLRPVAYNAFPVDYWMDSGWGGGGSSLTLAYNSVSVVDWLVPIATKSAAQLSAGAYLHHYERYLPDAREALRLVSVQFEDLIAGYRMCKARDWQQVRTAACLFCFLLCVLLNVHLQSAAAADSAVYRTNQSRRHLNLIMLEYGGSNKSVNLHGLERLMVQIGLLKNQTAQPVEHKEEHEHEHENEHEHEMEAKQSANETGTVKECPTARQMLSWYPSGQAFGSLTEPEFLDLCPTLVYLLHSKACSRGSTPDPAKPPGRTWKVWGASLLAVLITSLGGVATIFIIRPLMRTRFYTLVVQFLIALAVGSLSGDAFLHLLPHALFPEDDHKHEHKEGGESGGLDHMATMYRCLTALTGIYCFFVIERITVLCQNRRSRRRSSSRRPQSNSSNVGEKLCNPFHRSYANLTGGAQPESVICEAAAAAAAEAAEAAADDLTVEFLHDCNRCNRQRSRSASDTNGNNGGSCFRRLSACGSPDDKQQQRNNHHNRQRTTIARNRRTPGPAAVAAQESELTSLSTNAASAATDSAVAAGAAPPAAPPPALSVTFDDDVGGNGDDADESEGRGHGHGHHGHSHSQHHSQGAGLDCHHWRRAAQLLRRWGDFAVLLQAGMSVRMALLANLVSSLVCLLGMVCGVLLAKGATNWVFMVTAGMFL
uniref:Zinc transporter ZIP10 n=1 Tax=Macrostomum lignano TaxID=282301 RepID=A0A1I8HEM3_9PLAT